MLSPAQPAAAEGVLAQPDRPLKLLQHLDPAVGEDLGDDHPQGVGPHVDGATVLAVASADSVERDWTP